MSEGFYTYRQRDNSIMKQNSYNPKMLDICQAMKMFEIIVEKEGQKFLGWRKVPTRETVLGQKALESCPAIYQAFIKRPQGMENDQDFDRNYMLSDVF